MKKKKNILNRIFFLTHVAFLFAASGSVADPLDYVTLHFKNGYTRPLTENPDHRQYEDVAYIKSRKMSSNKISSGSYCILRSAAGSSTDFSAMTPLKMNQQDSVQDGNGNVIQRTWVSPVDRLTWVEHPDYLAAKLDCFSKNLNTDYAVTSILDQFIELRPATNGAPVPLNKFARRNHLESKENKPSRSLVVVDEETMTANMLNVLKTKAAQDSAKNCADGACAAPLVKAGTTPPETKGDTTKDLSDAAKYLYKTETLPKNTQFKNFDENFQPILGTGAGDTADAAFQEFLKNIEEGAFIRQAVRDPRPMQHNDEEQIAADIEFVCPTQANQKRSSVCLRKFLSNGIWNIRTLAYWDELQVLAQLIELEGKRTIVPEKINQLKQAGLVHTAKQFEESWARTEYEQVDLKILELTLDPYGIQKAQLKGKSDLVFFEIVHDEIADYARRKEAINTKINSGRLSTSEKNELTREASMLEKGIRDRELKVKIFDPEEVKIKREGNELAYFQGHQDHYYGKRSKNREQIFYLIKRTSVLLSQGYQCDPALYESFLAIKKSMNFETEIAQEKEAEKEAAPAKTKEKTKEKSKAASSPKGGTKTSPGNKGSGKVSTPKSKAEMKKAELEKSRSRPRR